MLGPWGYLQESDKRGQAQQQGTAVIEIGGSHSKGEHWEPEGVKEISGAIKSHERSIDLLVETGAEECVAKTQKGAGVSKVSPHGEAQKY